MLPPTGKAAHGRAATRRSAHAGTSKSFPLLFKLTQPSAGPMPESFLKCNLSPAFFNSTTMAPVPKRANCFDFRLWPSRTTMPPVSSPPTTFQTLPFCSAGGNSSSGSELFVTLTEVDIVISEAAVEDAFATMDMVGAHSSSSIGPSSAGSCFGSSLATGATGSSLATGAGGSSFGFASTTGGAGAAAGGSGAAAAGGSGVGAGASFGGAATAGAAGGDGGPATALTGST
mmetsp:Transcript_66193/g.148555  ORF Transcript_66193/g.148555 Transcript_66193/m.148555 type:complete len:230 (-) Transcript_66193:194-883(-)